MEHRMPLWVKIFIAIGAVIVVGAVAIGGEHGPGRHDLDHVPFEVPDVFPAEGVSIAPGPPQVD